MLQVLQVLRPELTDAELRRLDYVLKMSRDEFLTASITAEVLGTPPVDFETYKSIEREFNEAIQLLREGSL